MRPALFLSAMLMTGCLSTPANLAKPTVMITNLQKTSGGSGVVIRSSDNESIILTNGHVCKVARNGGLVITDDQESYPIVSFVLSQIHDLCLLKVSSNLNLSAPFAKHAPKTYDTALISGHPHLLPTTITPGHFSGKHVIQVMIGIRSCSPEEAADPRIGLFCILAGGIPDVKNYESILVTATILPGSSGSAIYNGKGEISALVFAGSGEFGYSESVPYEYIAYFLKVELPTLIPQVPNMSVNFASNRNSSKYYLSKVSEVCKNTKVVLQQKICDLLQEDAKDYK